MHILSAFYNQFLSHLDVFFCISPADPCPRDPRIVANMFYIDDQFHENNTNMHINETKSTR